MSHSIQKLTQQIREKSQALQDAHNRGDDEAAETLEDELYDLQEELEEAIEAEHQRHDLY